MLPRKRKELWEEMEKARSRTLEMAGADPRSVEYPHPLFGNINLYEWPCLIVFGHEKQHHAQIAEILRKLRG